MTELKSCPFCNKEWTDEEKARLDKVLKTIFDIKE